MNPDARINFQSLANTDIESLLNCFNESFKNYYVPLQLTKEQLTDKIYSEAIDLKLSFGAFDNDKLVAFILNGIDIIDEKKTAYNAGTGVLPAYRGKNISASLYRYTIEQLRKNGIERSVLEVIDLNIPAIKTYERIGFTITAKLVSYKGKPIGCKKDMNIEVADPDWNKIKQLCSWNPAWQYNINTLKRALNNYTLFIARGNKDEAYCIANLKNGRVAHFGSTVTGKQLLPSLFAHLAETIEPPLTIIHVDEKAVEANDLILETGMQLFITSYEMKMDLI